LLYILITSDMCEEGVEIWKGVYGRVENLRKYGIRNQLQKTVTADLRLVNHLPHQLL